PSDGVDAGTATFASPRRTAANSPRLPSSPVSRLRILDVVLPVVTLCPDPRRYPSRLESGRGEGTPRRTTTGAGCDRSLGGVEPHAVCPLDMLVEAAVEV